MLEERKKIFLKKNFFLGRTPEREQSSFLNSNNVGLRGEGGLKIDVFLRSLLWMAHFFPEQQKNKLNFYTIVVHNKGILKHFGPPWEIF